MLKRAVTGASLVDPALVSIGIDLSRLSVEKGSDYRFPVEKLLHLTGTTIVENNLNDKPILVLMLNRFAQILSKQRSATNLTFVVTRSFIQAASEYSISLDELEKAAADSRTRNEEGGIPR